MTWLIGQAFPVERASDDAARLDAAAIDTTTARERNRPPSRICVTVYEAILGGR